MKFHAIVPARYDTGDDLDRLGAELISFCDAVQVRTEPGLGPSYLAAWKTLADDEYALHVDVGHDPADALDVTDAMFDMNVDIVIGSRFCPGGTHRGNWQRKQTSKAAAFLCNLLTFYNVADWTSGLRCYSPRARDVLSRCDYQSTGHAWQMESLWYAKAAGLRVVEVPIHYVAGHSSLNRARIMEAVKLWQQMLWAPPASSWQASSATRRTT